MPFRPRLFDYDASGNCLKVRATLRLLGRDFERVPVDIFAGETLGDDYVQINTMRTTPVLEVAPGRHLAESNAILLHLAEGTPFLPAPGLERTRVHQWMFFEQNRLEGDLAMARFIKLTGRAVKYPEVFEHRLARGRDALAALDRGLADGRAFVAGDAYTVADIALYAYAHCGADAGADPAEHQHLPAWLERVEATPGFVNDLAPFPETG